MERTRRAYQLSLSSICAATVCVATMALSVYVPSTRGYFNVGEVAIYTVAFLFGPYVGAFAGGIGAMIADLVLGYAIFAPATLLIKAVEGALVGSVYRRRASLSSSLSRILTYFFAVILGIMIGYLGVAYYTGDIELSVGLPSMTYVLNFQLPAFFWLTVAAVVSVLTVLSGYRLDQGMGWRMLSASAGGIIMVLGYFLYELVIIGPASVAEIPINIGQFIIGLLVSIPLSKAISGRIPFLREGSRDDRAKPAS